MGQRVTRVGELNRKGRRRETESEEGVGYFKRYPEVDVSRPEAGRSIHDQGEGAVTRSGGPHSLLLKK